MIVTMIIPNKVGITLTKKESVIFNMNPGNVGGDGTQSDWNQNDEEALDYIKNKPTIPTVSDIISAIYPVGSIYSSVNNTSPELLFGGTWERFSQGKVLVGVNEGDGDFATPELSGGAKEVKSSAQKFAGNRLPDHIHNEITAGRPGGLISPIAATITLTTRTGAASAYIVANAHTHPAPVFTGDIMAAHQHPAANAGTPEGENTPGDATSVVQPYITVYMWKRTA